MDRKQKLMKKTVGKAMDDARNTGEASGHARYNMSRLGREKDKLAAKRRETKEEVIPEAKYEAGASTYGKASIRNKRRFGTKGENPDPLTGKKITKDATRGELIAKRREEHKTKRGVKTKGMSEAKVDDRKVFGVTADRNERRFGKKGAFDMQGSGSRGQDPSERAKLAAKRGAEHRARRGVKTKGMKEELVTELNRFEKEKGTDTKTGKPIQKGGSAKKDLAFQAVMKKYSNQRMGGNEPKKVRGAKSDEGTGRITRMVAKKKEQQAKSKALDAKAKKAGYKSTQDYVNVQAVRKGGLGT